MRTLPEIFLHILPQGWWGAKSKRPTGASHATFAEIEGLYVQVEIGRDPY